MQQHVGQVVAPGVIAEDFPVDHVGNPGQRDPVRAVRLAEGLRDGLPGKAVDDQRVLLDEERVVNIDELVAEGRAEDGRHGQRRAARDGRYPPACGIRDERLRIRFQGFGTRHILAVRRHSTLVTPGMAMGYRPWASGSTGAGWSSEVMLSSPGASSNCERKASSHEISCPDSAAMRPRMPVMAAMAHRWVSLYGLSWRMASKSRSCSRW